MVVAIRRELTVAITDDACAPRWRGAFAPERAELAGPSPGPDLWAAVPEAAVRELFATDALPSGGTNQLHLVPSAGGHRHVLVVQTGSVGRLRYGWRALALGCHAGACDGRRVGHAERAPLPPALGCGMQFRAYRAPPDADTPLVRVAPGDAPGELLLTPVARARDTCGAAAETLRDLSPFRVAPR